MWKFKNVYIYYIKALKKQPLCFYFKLNKVKCI
jgi:hypothetical protein